MPALAAAGAFAAHDLLARGVGDVVGGGSALASDASEGGAAGDGGAAVAVPGERGGEDGVRVGLSGGEFCDEGEDEDGGGEDGKHGFFFRVRRNYVDWREK